MWVALAQIYLNEAARSDNIESLAKRITNQQSLDRVRKNADNEICVPPAEGFRGDSETITISRMCAVLYGSSVLRGYGWLCVRPEHRMGKSKKWAKDVKLDSRNLR